MRNFRNVFAKVYEHLQKNQTLESKLILYQPLAGNINQLQPFTTCSDNLQQYRPLSAQKPLAKKYIKNTYQKIISSINSSSGKRQKVEFTYSSATLGNNN